MIDGTYRALKNLADTGSIAWSALSNRAARRLQPLLDAGALVRRRRGRGMAIDVVDRIALDRFTAKLFPHGDAAMAADDGPILPPRAEAVGTYRDAKRAHSAAAEPVLLRATAPAQARRGADALDLFELSRTAGAACLLLDDGATWQIGGKIAIVENLEAFLLFERLCTNCPIALYSNGRLSGRALNWLASEEMRGVSFLHCGDYDPVGLDEFLRLHNAVRDRVELYVPGNISDLFTRYGKRDLLRDSSVILSRLRAVDHPVVSRLVQLMDSTGCGLEQEALLLPAAQPACSVSSCSRSYSPS